MADEKQKTADEIRAEAAKRKALEALAAFAPAPAAPAGAPAPPSALVWQVPVPKADVPTPLDEAQQFMDLLGALEQRQAELQHGSTTGTAAKAGQMAEDAGMSDTGRPPPLPAERSWTDQFLRTFGQQVVREDQAPASLWDRAKAAASAGVDMVPVLRVMENPTLQALQARTQQFRDAKSDGTALGNVSAGLQRGVSRSIDALVPDNTTGEALTGVRTTGGVEVANALGQGLEGIGRDLQAEVAGADPGLFASQKAKAGLALEAFGRAGQLPAQAVDSLNTFTGHQRPAEPGMSGESGLLTLLRPATLPMAMAAEAAKAMPVPLGTKSTLDALGLRKDLRPPLPEDASLLDKAKRFAEPVTLGEMAGVPAGSFQQIDRSKPSGVDVVVPAPLRNYTQAVLERIEKQQGLEAEGEAIATQLGGKEWARTGWVVGAIADAVLEPERMGAAVLGKGAKLARRTAALGEVAPDLTLVQRAMQAASQPTVEAGKVYGGQFVEALRSGQATLDDLPPGVREHADDIAAERRVLLEEQMALDGLAPMPRTIGEAGAARLAAETEQFSASQLAAAEAASPLAEIERLRTVAMEASARAAAATEAYKGALRGPARRPDPEEGPGPIDVKKREEARRAALDAEAQAAQGAKPTQAVARRPEPESGPGPIDVKKRDEARRAALDAEAAASAQPAKPALAGSRPAPEAGPGSIDVKKRTEERQAALDAEAAAAAAQPKKVAPLRVGGLRAEPDVLPDVPPPPVSAPGRRPITEAKLPGDPSLSAREAVAASVADLAAAKRRSDAANAVVETVPPARRPITPAELLVDLGDAREAAATAAADLSAAMKRRRDAANAVVETVPRKAAPTFEPTPAAPAEPVGVRLGDVPRVKAEMAAERAARAEAAVADAIATTKVPKPKAKAEADHARAELLKGSPVYVVRNALEDELHVTENLDEALDWMRSRGIEGDRVWDDTAPVAVWRTDADGSRLAPGAKARGYNGVVVADVAGKHPPQQLRSLFSAEQREVGQAAASAVSGLPAGAVGDLPSEQIIRDAYNRWALDRLGTDELTFLPNGAQVSHADRARIMRQVDGDLGELGMAPPPPTVGLFGAKKTTGQVTEGADVAMIGRQLTDDERVKVARLAAKYRMTSTPDVTTTKGLRAFRQAAIEYHGGALASAKSAVKGKPGLADMLQTAVETFNTDRAVKGKMALAMRPLVAPFLDAFFSNPTAGLSPAGRSAILRGRSRLERLADEVLGGLKAEIGQFRRERGQLVAPLTQGQMAEVYRRVLGDDVAVVAADMARVRELRAGEAVTDEAIKRIASEVALPRWATTDDLVRRAVSEWAARKEADAASWAADYLRAMAATGGLGVKPGDAVSQYIMKNRERLLGVYDEVFLQGRFDGPTVVDTFAKLGAGPAGTQPRIAVSSSQAMLAFLVTRRRAEVLNDTLEELKHAGLVVTKKEYDARGLPSGAANPHVFAALLAGTTTAYKDGSVVELYAPGARAWARRRAARMGIEPGAGPGEDLVAMSAGGTTFMVPRYLEQRLMSSLTAGKVSPQGLDTPTALTLTGAADAGAGGVVMQGLRINDSLMRTWKALQTSGAPLLPRSLHVMAQGLGVLQSTWTTRGVVEAIKSAADVGKSLAPTKVRVLFPDIVSQMMGRLVSGSDGPAAAPLFGSRRFLRDVNGQLHSVEDLTAAARDYGLGDTLLSFETARHLESLLFSEMTVAGRAMFGPAAYTEMVTDYIGGFDQAARLSTFLREVERGTPLADAAKLARQSALDFRDLTNFEATWMRRLWTWYALQRKTADTLVREIVRNPGRVTSQMRAAHNLATDGLTAEQQGALTDRDVSSIWLGMGGTEGTTTEAGVNGQRVNPRWYWRARTPPVQIPEFLSNLAFFLAPPAVGAEEYAGAVNPLVDMATIAVAGQKTLGTGQDVDLTRNAVVPPVFLHVPFGGAETLVDLFDIAPVSLRSPDLERSSHLESDPTAEQALGEPAVWVVGAGDSTPEERTLRRRMWAEFMLFFAGQAKTATGYGRAAGALPPRQDLTWEQEALFSVGIEMQRLPTTQETIDQFRIGRAGERKAETRAQEGMTGE